MAHENDVELLENNMQKKTGHFGRNQPGKVMTHGSGVHHCCLRSGQRRHIV